MAGFNSAGLKKAVKQRLHRGRILSGRDYLLVVAYEISEFAQFVGAVRTTKFQ